MSYGKCWVCGCVMSGDSQTLESKDKGYDDVVVEEVS